jgi:hypothetical protein
MIACALNFKAEPKSSSMLVTRSLNQANLDSINERLEQAPFGIVDQFYDVADKWFCIKKLVMDIVDECAPLHKKGDPTNRDNYREISVLPPISKVFESMLSSQILEYFESNNLFTSTQHGLRKHVL